MGTLSMPIDEAAETPKCSPGTSDTVFPFDISPVPNIKKRTTTRGRKATRSSLITGSPYKDQLTKSLEKSAPKKTSLSVPGVRNRPEGRRGKTKGLQKKKIRPTKRYDSSSDSSDYYDPPLLDSDDDIDLDIKDGDKPDSRKATCIFCDGKFSEDTRGEVWVKCVMCQMLAHLDCAGAETASYVCDFFAAEVQRTDIDVFWTVHHGHLFVFQGCVRSTHADGVPQFAILKKNGRF
ncbi:hypothetical protein AVEN_240523-1 [Araneus ventricosus]|uniref:Uncharacterized protein n=1 Tax=Araneus ventricosus TaxID=182803 RepID=A0A4Y2L3Q4_ARAVE|nr:hypothetical protein AVEN_240523-1 [Araneus ventricosus]